MLRGLLTSRENWDDIAVIEGNRKVTYRELSRRALAVRTHLPPEPNASIAIYLPNGSDYISALFAVLMSGMTAFPLNASMTRHEAAPLLEQVKVPVLITSKRYRGLFDDIPGLQIIYIECVHMVETVYVPAVDADIDGPAVLLGTSGTTGRSKIVQLSARNIETSFLGYADKMRFGDADRLRFILATPFSSAYGIMILSACLMKSYPIVLIEGAFTLDTLYKTAGEHRVTNYEGGSLTVQMMDRLAGRPVPYDISTLKCFGFGGSKVPGSTIDRLMDAYPGVGFFQGYGMTEAAPLITKHDRARPPITDSVGSAIKGVELAIEADGVITREPHTKGEILVKGPNVMLGYYQNEAETERVIKNGWLHTGDIGYLDLDGFLYICGRMKSIIIVGGLNVYPEEVEACILESPLVKDCLVYGHADGFGNEMVCVDVVPASQRVAAEDIMAWCAARLAGYKRPREISLCGEIGKNAAGKANRQKHQGQERDL